ncbi:spore germination protein [Paenibacillus sepulcri]|uniref:Spore germination protein n=1 Tax=Paenibacillus sepulcri TaxID=359917 RepID=A0ABS7C536_9BACL|nr:spore germination protein [Paenibacillus sepulcri]
MEKLGDEPTHRSINETVLFLQELLKDSDDFIIREFDIHGHYPAVLFYYFSLADKTQINEDVLRPLMRIVETPEEERKTPKQLADMIKRQTLTYSPIKTTSKISELVDGISRGSTVLAIEGLDEVLIMGCRDIGKRAIEQPPTEQVIQGPREGFIEHLDDNLGLIRYRLMTPDLRVKVITLGRVTKTDVAITYLDGIVNPELVQEVEKRLSNIDIDGIMDAGYLEQFIEDNYLSPFPQVQNTEKPDKVVANLLEGRVSILVDGTPFALIVPAVFNQFYQVTEDYTSRFLQGSFIRVVRVIALVFSLIFPSLYVAIISFNPELIPTEFAVAVAGGRAGVPFPSFFEVLIVEISMEVLREATIRLPQQVGGALSIVGVLVIGQAAVAAGFASPITVVVIALTTIGSFATPAYNSAFALRMLRFPLIIMAGMFGLYGVVIGLIVIGNHMLSLKSFGVPYMSPAVPVDMQGFKDLVTRAPIWSMKLRPAMLHSPDPTRVGEKSQPNHEQQSNVLDPMQNTESEEGGNQDGSSSDNDGSGGSGYR